MSLPNVSRERTWWVTAAPIGVWWPTQGLGHGLLSCLGGQQQLPHKAAALQGLSVAWLQPNLKAMIYSVLCEYFHKTTCDDLNYR